MANSACLYCDILSREDGYILKRALEFEVEGQRKAEGHMEEAG